MMSKVLLFLFFLSVFPHPALAWLASPVRVIDGDTFVVESGGVKTIIRLYGVDSPEISQSFGYAAKEFTAAFMDVKKVRIETVGRDRYGRAVAWVYSGSQCLNMDLVKAGLAWHYKKYSDDIDIANLETEARLAKRGLWSEDNPLPGWLFRKNE